MWYLHHLSPGGACDKRWQEQPVRASSGFSYVVVMSIVNLDFTIVYAYWFILHRKGKSNISINQKKCTFFKTTTRKNLADGLEKLEELDWTDWSNWRGWRGWTGL